MKHFVETQYQEDATPERSETEGHGVIADLLSGCPGSEIIWERRGEFYFKYRFFTR